MKESVLLELAKRWDGDAREPTVENGSVEAELDNAVAKGRRHGMRECADGLRTLVSLLGDSE